MRDKTGWLLDVYVDGDDAALWVKAEHESVTKLKDHFKPSVYILPKDETLALELYTLLQRQPDLDVTWDERYVSLRNRKKRRLIQIAANVSILKNLVRRLSKFEHVKELFNVDLHYVQQYLFNQLKIEPTSKINFTCGCDKLVSMEKLDDEKEIPPPPFTALYFDLQLKTTSLTPNADRDPIGFIEARCKDEEEVFQGDEPKIIQSFAEYVRVRDPDFLVSPECSRTFTYLLIRSRLLGLNPKLGREEADITKISKPLPYWIRGRIALDYNSFGYTFEDWGIAGLVERARFSFLPPGIAGRWTSNRIIDSRNCYELIQRGYAIPKNTGYYEYIRPMQEVVERDKGGMIISPKIGVVHENVAELDYNSQYPNLIVKECISYETVTPKGVTRRRDALLPYVTKHCLERRLYFKRLRKNFSRNSSEWHWCEQRQSALKLILVCLYGTSGCCWNRFGNVIAFEEINRKSREVMLKTKDYVQEKGFEVIYADTDSIFVKKPGASKEDFEGLAEDLTEHIGLSISLDHHYKFLVLLPLQSDPSGIMEAQKHYFGLLQDGEVLARGIELRRHDTPKFIKDFQAKLIRILLDCEDAQEVWSNGYERALLAVTKAIDRVMTGEVQVEDLVVSKILRKPASKYRSIVPHVAASIQLASRGRNIKPGEAVDFIYTDADHQNPLCRVVPYDLIQGRVEQDREKYRDILLDAAETVLSTFGFTRELYSLDKLAEQWWQQPREERERDVILQDEAEDSTRW